MSRVGGWTPKLILLLRQWHKEFTSNKKLKLKKSQKYGRIGLLLGVLIIFFSLASTVISSSNTGSTEIWPSIVVATISGLATAIGSFVSLVKPSATEESNKSAALVYTVLIRAIETQVSLPKSDRQNAREFLNYILNSLNDLGEAGVEGGGMNLIDIFEEDSDETYDMDEDSVIAFRQSVKRQRRISDRRRRQEDPKGKKNSIPIFAMAIDVSEREGF